MPTPIRPSKAMDEKAQNWVEFTVSRPVIADDEASLLYDIWKSAPPGSKVFAAPKGMDQRKVMTLKAKGFISGFGDSLELTERGRRIVVEMVTHEPNAFEIKQASMTYSEIKKNGCKRPIQSLLKKHAQATPPGKVVENIEVECLRCGSKAMAPMYSSLGSWIFTREEDAICKKCGGEMMDDVLMDENRKHHLSRDEYEEQSGDVLSANHAKQPIRAYNLRRESAKRI